LSNAPEPKRRFIPSKWEAKKVIIPLFTSVEMFRLDIGNNLIFLITLKPPYVYRLYSMLEQFAREQLLLTNQKRKMAHISCGEMILVQQKNQIIWLTFLPQSRNYLVLTVTYILENQNLLIDSICFAPDFGVSIGNIISLCRP